MGIVGLLIYFDDIVITGFDSALLRSPSGISLNQHKYASDLVATTGLQEATSIDTPMELNIKLRKEEGDLLDDPSLYRKLGISPRGLFFPTSNSPRLAAYSDVDWVGYADTHRSITGWCVFLGGALISWKNTKQDKVFKSSTESEYRAKSLACFEII
ncbi:hypothetical protein F2P56_016052 [Juglans regia]|uniref:Uncharacterized mitochondrial protein AtMg00810-like n=2 Tax=Juglans regia TaxID=51240 RepID=A0A2I4EGS1_JUGRE|nr:uncharacterized mitochondrial protein AtMg00810-like [Juglans regia]KAF5466095.1 hypothetical protein F2P56_016052 [Juglans regia]